MRSKSWSYNLTVKGEISYRGGVEVDAFLFKKSLK